MSVPVLSRSTTSVLPSNSKIAPPLIITPFLADCDNPETIAIGTANINGHGVAVTKTATARSTSPVRSQAAPAIIKAIGTNLIAHLLAILILGEFLSWAVFTKRIMDE